jgi:pimeloyl-ACP methyl ester carboxylesterase
MPSISANGIEIYFEQYGSRANPPILLIHGLACQIIHWPAGLIDTLTEAGFRVIVMDNRDVGRSAGYEQESVPSLEAVIAGFNGGPPVAAPYNLSDMSADAVALLDHLGQAGAHVVGFSMGGMIAQRAAIENPERVYSLTSIASSTGNPELPPASAEAMQAFVSMPPQDRAEAIAHNCHAWNVIGGSHYPSERYGLARQAEMAFDRGFSRDGFVRQVMAIVNAGDRRAELEKLHVPTLVIHGAEDPLIPLAAGEDTANTIPGAEILTLEHMGHDLPDPLARVIASRIAQHAQASNPER